MALYRATLTYWPVADHYDSLIINSNPGESLTISKLVYFICPNSWMVVGPKYCISINATFAEKLSYRIKYCSVIEILHSVINDNSREDLETFGMYLTETENGELLNSPKDDATVYIADNDDNPREFIFGPWTWVAKEILWYIWFIEYRS